MEISNDVEMQLLRVLELTGKIALLVLMLVALIRIIGWKGSQFDDFDDIQCPITKKNTLMNSKPTKNLQNNKREKLKKTTSCRKVSFAHAPIFLGRPEST